MVMMNLPSEIRKVLQELIGEHQRVYISQWGERQVVESGLIHQLQESVESTITPGGSGGGSTAPGCSVNLGSIVLQDNIEQNICSLSRQHSPNSYNSVPPYSLVINQKVSLATRLHIFVCSWWKEENHRWMLEFLQGTIIDIRNHLDPPKPPLPLRGARCPRCGEYEVFECDDGGTYRKPSLIYMYSDRRVHCIACQHSYDLHNLT